MKNKSAWAMFLILCFLGFLPILGGQRTRDRIGYRDTIVVSANETRDNVVTFGGDINIEGKVRKNVLAVGGSITVSGEVGDSVVGVGSKITLKSTAVIKGDLVGLGGTIDKEPGFRVDGDTVYFKSSDLSAKIFKEGFKGIFSLSLLPIILIFKLVTIFLWFLMALLVASLFPKQVTFASGQVRKSFWPVFGTGLLAIILFIILIVFAAILCLVLIGLPILFCLVIASVIIAVFGRVALFYFFGESLAKALNQPKISPLGGALLGLLVVSLLSFVPFLGFLFTFCLIIIGWGAAIRTKFGTRENWFRREIKS